MVLSNQIKKREIKKHNYEKFNERNHLYCDYVKPSPKKPKRLKNKRKGNFLTRLCFLLILSLYGYYVCPYLYFEYLKPIFLNRFFNRNIKININNYTYPTRRYLHNSFLLDRYLIVSGNNNSKEIRNIKMTGEFTDLKNQLEEMFKKYPNLQPSVFVWEYSTGMGLEINADKQISSASIIKIPILFKLIRLIDETSKSSNPISLTDKMTFTEEFRTEGSGNLQRTKADVDYTLDYLANIMISDSDNSATNMLLYKIGGIDAFNRFTRNVSLKDTSMTNWLPDIEGLNKTSAREVSNILFNIDNPNFINPKYKNTIKEYLAGTKNTHLLKEKLPDDVMILHKTGNIGKMLGDSGIVYTGNSKKYIITIMVERPHNNQSAKTLIQDASLLIYNYINLMK